MSQDTALPDPQSAYDFLFDGIRQRVFFHKLAQIRPQYMPQNEKQAAAILDLDAKLSLLEDEVTVKQAEESIDPFTAASMALDNELDRCGFSSVKTAYAQEELLSVKRAAAELMQNPDVYNSVLALKAHEAEEIVQKYGHK